MQIIEPVDPQAFKTQFPDRTFRLRHNLAGNPLFSLERLIDLSPAEIIKRIETCNAWMVLKRVESDPLYRALLMRRC